MTPESQRWIDAAEKIAKDSNEKVQCPRCGHEFLKIEKVPWPNFDKVDIYMYCEKCQAHNVLTSSMLRKSSE
jgi:hypothetical protein